jgi:hypothetical protein
MTRSPGSDVGEELPRWKVIVAAGVLASVAVVTITVVMWRELNPAPSPGSEGAATERRPAAATPSPDAQASESALSDRAPSPAAERDAMIAGVRAALDAWETFARSGDTADVADAFVVGGPQYRQFRREARRGRAGVAAGLVPDMSLRFVSAVDETGRRRDVAARVVLTGADGEQTVRAWVFVLERVSGSWRVWTIIDQTGGT